MFPNKRMEVFPLKSCLYSENISAVTKQIIIYCAGNITKQKTHEVAERICSILRE